MNPTDQPIIRWEMSIDGQYEPFMYESENGTYVKFTDHLSALEKERAKNKKWKLEFKLREELEKFCEWMMDAGYIDTDWFAEEPKAIDSYIEETIK